MIQPPCWETRASACFLSIIKRNCERCKNNKWGAGQKGRFSHKTFSFLFSPFAIDTYFFLDYNEKITSAVPIFLDLYLFEKGLDKILKKCGEENAEMIIAAKNHNSEELANEICDLFYHILVLMEQEELPLERVLEILDQRSKKIGNLKQFHQVDRNT